MRKERSKKEGMKGRARRERREWIIKKSRSNTERRREVYSMDLCFDCKC